MQHFQQLHEISALKTHFEYAPYSKHIQALKMVVLKGNEPPWQTTEIAVRKGQEFSIFARGTIGWTASRPELYGGPAFHLWARISPSGQVMNLSGDTGSFVADTDGTIELCIYMGMWADSSGRLTHTNHYRRLLGEIYAVVTHWKNTAADGIQAQANPLITPPLLAIERTRLSHQYTPPTGWSYLCETGAANIYHQSQQAAERSIVVDAQNDQGIIRLPIDAPLTEDIKLSWEWQLNEHPSVGPEDRADCHDYLSIATEFDNGRDLTWIWSQYLTRNHHFHCPVRDWSARETHWVVRTANAPFDTWLTDQRQIYQDVCESQGEPPTRIVAIWLIAVSTFSHGRIRGAFRNINLHSAGYKLRAL